MAKNVSDWCNFATIPANIVAGKKPPQQTAARASSQGVTGLTVGEVFGPGRVGSIGDLFSVGNTIAPAACAASPVE